MARTSIEMPALQMHWTWFNPHLPIVEFINCPVTTSQSHSVILPSCMLEGQTGNTYIVLHPSMSSLERQTDRQTPLFRHGMTINTSIALHVSRVDKKIYYKIYRIYYFIHIFNNSLCPHVYLNMY